MDIAPRVSIIVATNRNGEFLAEALASVTSQTFTDWEVVVVDDGSQMPEAIAATVARFDGIRLLRQPPGGVSRARNHGVIHTSGDYLVFLDDDDVWSPDRLAAQVAALDAHPEASLSYCGMRTIDTFGSEIAPNDQVQVSGRREILQRRTGIILPNVMVRRSAFERFGGFHPAFRRAQDLDLVLKAADLGTFVFVPETLVSYRAHASNNTRSHHELVRSIDQIVDMHRWAAAEAGRTDDVRDHRLSLDRNACFAVWGARRRARELMRDGRPGAAAGELWWALRTKPLAPLSWLRIRSRDGSAARRDS